MTLMGMMYGLIRTSPTPLYPQQNDLDPYLSGQIGIFLVKLKIGIFIAVVGPYLGQRLVMINENQMHAQRQWSVLNSVMFMLWS